VLLCCVFCATDPQSKRIAQLEGTLKHLRGWMHHVQENMQANGLQKDTVFNARRLFVGGIPAGTVEASNWLAPGMRCLLCLLLLLDVCGQLASLCM
jgi:hypothetical protein